MSLRCFQYEERKHSEAEHKLQNELVVDEVANVGLEYSGVDSPKEVDRKNSVNERKGDEHLSCVFAYRCEDDSRVLQNKPPNCFHHFVYRSELIFS